MMNEKESLTINDTAKKYGLSEMRLRRYLKENRLPGRFVGRKYLVDVGELFHMLGSLKVPMRTGVAVGLFSDINTEKYTDEEKLEAIEIVMRSRDFAGAKRDAMKDVIWWLWKKNVEQGAETPNDE